MTVLFYNFIRKKMELKYYELNKISFNSSKLDGKSILLSDAFVKRSLHSFLYDSSYHLTSSNRAIAFRCCNLDAVISATEHRDITFFLTLLKNNSAGIYLRISSQQLKGS